MAHGTVHGAPIDTDVNLGGGSPSDQLIPSQKAVKTYVDAAGGAGGPATEIEESSGPTTLTVGAVADGQVLKRSGSTLIGVFIALPLVATLPAMSQTYPSVVLDNQGAPAVAVNVSIA